MTELRKILVTGATGKQGGAVIDSLLASNQQVPFEILAVTRNTSSQRALTLATKPNVTLIEGDFDRPDAIFDKAGAVYGVFAVQTPSLGNKDLEEKQGKALVDAAVANKVQHFVFTSVDRGGAEKSGSNSTPVPHFISKHNIEKHLQKRAVEGSHQMRWTILRAVAFYENLTPDFFGKGFASMWKGVGDKELELISVRDIGDFAAMAFMNPKNYQGQAVSIAGDSLTFNQANIIFREEFGNDMPIAPWVVGKALKWFIRDLGLMFQWFVDEGFGDGLVEKTRQEKSDTMDFKQWLTQKSAFAAKMP
ncbi:MAG: hypothetical protein M1825_004378 [Sarcosagium campestre]|nr:MAG: hypothetical protein M1825_004378 [Sarcosagium campestre]